MNVKFPAHQQPNCWCEPCICLHHLWRLFLNNERTAIYKHIINKLTFIFNSHHGAVGQQPGCIHNLGRTTDIYSAASFSISELQRYHSTTTQTTTKPWKPARYAVSTCSYNVRFKVLTSALLSFKSSRMWRCICSHRYVVLDVTKDNRVFIYRVKQSKTKKNLHCLTMQINTLPAVEIWGMTHPMTQCKDPQNMNFQDHHMMALWWTKILFFSEALMYLIHNSQYSSTYHSTSTTQIQ